VPSAAPARKSGKPVESKKEDNQHDQASNCVPCQVEAKFNHRGTIDPDAEYCQASRDENSNGRVQRAYPARAAWWYAPERLAGG
jgi:hypothetical protein